jgi:hypothetical protein
MALIAGAQAAEVSPSRLTGILPLRTEATIRTEGTSSCRRAFTVTIREVVRYVGGPRLFLQAGAVRPGAVYPDVGGVGLLCGACMPAGSRPRSFSLPPVKDRRSLCR